MKYAFIWRHRKQFKIARLCGALGVSRSGFYDWLSRPESHHAVADRELLRQIRALHVQARQAYGAYYGNQKMGGSCPLSQHQGTVRFALSLVETWPSTCVTAY